jgi:serine/threonine-protein kinase
MIGVVELLARDAWLQMSKGPLAGKEFLIFRDAMNVGASPRCDIYLFNDPQVAQLHAKIRTTGDTCEIQNIEESNPTLLNNRPVKNSRLRNGDQITIGQTEFIFQMRKG